MRTVFFYSGKEKRLEEKIKKWEEEIERIAERQREMNARSNEQIRELRKKIQEAQVIVTRENNRMIADVVREVYGEVNRENLEAFKRTIQELQLKREQEQPQKMTGFQA